MRQLIDADLARYAKFVKPGTDAADYHSIKTQWAAAQAAVAPLVKGSVRDTAATQALVGKVDNANFVPLQTSVTSWLSVNQALANRNARKITATYHSAKTVGIVLLIVAVLLGLAIAFFVSRSIKQRVDVVLDRIRSLQQHCITWVREGIEAFAAAI